MKKIGYISEPPQDYSAAISKVNTLVELRAATKEFYPVAWDAARVAAKMTDADFERFLKCRAMERRNKYSGDENQDLMGPLLMPETLIKVGIVAHQFSVPWGLAFIRLREVGRIKETGRRFVVLLPPNGKAA